MTVEVDWDTRGVKGDHVIGAAADAGEIRTPALWGLRLRRPLVDIDDLEIILAGEVLLADGLDAGEGFGGAWRHAGDIQPEHVQPVSRPTGERLFKGV